MNTILWFVKQALEILALIGGIWIFIYILRNGTGAIKDLIQTIGSTVQAVCLLIRKKIITKMKERPEESKEEKATYEDYLEMLRKRGDMKS